MFLYGKHSVYERLVADPRSIKSIFVQDDFSDSLIFNKIKSLKLKVQRVGRKQMYRIKRADNLQGIVAEVSSFRYAFLEDLLSVPATKKISLLFIDRIYDPQNLGSIIRTAACFGGWGIVIAKHKACQVNETVLHVACGGENYVPVAAVSNISPAVREAKENGFWIYGAVAQAGEAISNVRFSYPLGIVLGSEGQGVRPAVQKYLDILVTIPMKGAGLSFNVTCAAAVFCYEISKQKML